MAMRIVNYPSYARDPSPLRLPLRPAPYTLRYYFYSSGYAFVGTPSGWTLRGRGFPLRGRAVRARRQTSCMPVEDHALSRQALAVRLDGEPDLRVIAQAGSLAEAREQAAAPKNSTRVAVVDSALAEGDARYLVRELLRRSSPNVKIVVITSGVDPGTATRARPGPRRLSAGGRRGLARPARA